MPYIILKRKISTDHGVTIFLVRLSSERCACAGEGTRSGRTWVTNLKWRNFKSETVSSLTTIRVHTEGKQKEVSVVRS